MLSLMRGEWYQARKSFAVRLVLVCTIIVGVWFERMAQEYYIANNQLEYATVGGCLCSMMQDTAMCLLYASVFAGLMIGGAFENRTIQSEICSGKKRTYVYLAKMVMYLLVVTVLSLAYWFSGAVVIGLRYGLGTSELIGNLSKPEYLVGMVIACVLANMSLSAICGMIGFMIRKTGVVMGVCFALILAGGNLLAALLPENVSKYFEYTPFRLAYRVLKYDLTWGEIGTTCLFSLLWIGFILGFGIWRFQRTELK